VIHPSAIVDPRARIGEGTNIGPWVLIEGDVEIGAGCEVQAHAVLTGCLRIGDRNVIGYGAILGAPPQDLSWKPDTPCGVRIGSDNVIREYTTIHRATKPEGWTQVGNHNFLMAGTHLAHDVKVGDHVIMANNCLLAGHVQVQDRAVLGGGSVFHQFMRIGTMAMIQGGCRFGKDIPPYLIAAGVNSVAGVNLVGLRRAGLSSEVRNEIRDAYRLLYRSGYNVRQALEIASQRTWSEPAQKFFDFIAGATKRGICSAARGPGEAGSE
jgi:UDP-N-acetylglucosamine acyltransferase